MPGFRCKAFDKVGRSPLQTIKRSRTQINCGSRKCLYFFHRTQIRQIWILDSLTHHVAVPQTADSPQKRKRKLCRRSPGAAGGVSLTDRTQCAALAAPSSAMVSAEGGARATAPDGRRGKINIKIPGGTDSCCSTNSNQKMTLFTLFWLV